MLLAHGAVIENASVLHASVIGGSIDMMEHVLKHGANINERDNIITMGYNMAGTPLLRAISRGKIDLVKFLLERGASILGYYSNGFMRFTALELVAADCMLTKGRISEELRELVEREVKKQKIEQELKKQEEEKDVRKQKRTESKL